MANETINEVAARASQDRAAQATHVPSPAPNAAGLRNWPPITPSMRRVLRKAARDSVQSTSAAGSIVPPPPASQDPLLTAAVQAVNLARPALMQNQQQKQQALHEVFYRAYALLKDHEQNPDRLQDRLRETGIKVRSDTPPAKLAVRIVLAAAGFKAPKGTEHEWSTVITAIDMDKVAISQADISAWLTTSAVIDGVTVSGFDRAQAKVASNTRDERKADRAQRQAQRQCTYADLVQQAAGQPLGEILPLEEREIPEGDYLCLARGQKLLGALNVTGPKLQSIVIKAGLQP